MNLAAETTEMRRAFKLLNKQTLSSLSLNMNQTHVELQESVDLSLQDRHPFQQLLSGHGPHHALSTEKTQHNRSRIRYFTGETTARTQDAG